MGNLLSLGVVLSTVTDFVRLPKDNTVRYCMYKLEDVELVPYSKYCSLPESLRGFSYKATDFPYSTKIGAKTYFVR